MGRLTEPVVLVATRNAHKLAEIRDLLGDLPIRFVGLDDIGLPESAEEDELEPFETFELNALSKAKYFHGRTGLPVLADDSGLCVDALGGGPGVRTKRFAPEEWAERWGRDEANNRWLLEKLGGLPSGDRGAHYVCAIALTDDLEHEVVVGRVNGVIADAPRGTSGFGYDPIFFLPGAEATYGELGEEVKRETSHRARALSRARPWLETHVLRSA